MSGQSQQHDRRAKAPKNANNDEDELEAEVQIGKRGPTQRSARSSHRATTSGEPASCLEKLDTSALARYCLRFSLTSGDPSILSREELLDAAKNHFNGMDLDEQSTVQEFVVAIRQQLTDGYKNYEMELRDE